MTEAETLTKYGDLVRSASRTIYAPHPYGREDLEQVGFMALLDAAARYNESRGVPFAIYAKLVVRARMVDAVRSWNPRWSRTLASETVEETSLDNILDKLSHLPSELLSSYDDETVVELRELLDRLSPRQQFCLVGRLAGLRTPEIAVQLGVSRPRVSQIISSIRSAA